MKTNHFSKLAKFFLVATFAMLSFGLNAQHTGAAEIEQDSIEERSYTTERIWETVPEGKIYTYKVVNGVPREIEIHFPEAKQSLKKPVPGIIMFHGGGWSFGDRKQFRYLCHYFASRGLVAATVSYTLAESLINGGKRVCITDAKSAIRWFKQNADELGIDPNRIIAGGGSAGGHIALLATCNPGLNDPNDPSGYDTSVAAYLLFNPALQPEDVKDGEVDFLQHLKADFPPAIVFFGDQDPWLKGWHTACQRMKTLGIESVDHWIAEGLEHSFFNNQPWADFTYILSDHFLNKLGYIEGDPTLTMPKVGSQLNKRLLTDEGIEGIQCCPVDGKN